MKITKSELQELVQEAIDEYRLINEAGNDQLSSEEKEEILNIANQYKNEINKEVKISNDKDFVLKVYDDTIRFRGIQALRIQYSDWKQEYGIFVKGEYYDFKNGYNKVCKMLIDKLNSDKTLSKKYTFESLSNMKTIPIRFKDSSKNKSAEMGKVEFDKLEKQIKTEFNYNDKSKIHNWTNKELISSIKNSINSSEYLSKTQKDYLMQLLKAYIEECKKHEEKANNTNNAETSNNTDNKYKKIFDELIKKLKESGYPSSKKTWWTEGTDYEEDYFQFVAYDEDYSGTGSDYDNGLTKADKAKNEQFVKKLVEIIKQLRSEFKCTIDYDIYRGHGTVTVSFNK